MIVDGHLDLAENSTLFARDLTKPAEEIRTADPHGIGEATVSLPELRRGGIAVAIATVTAGFRAEDVGPQTPATARVQAGYRTPKGPAA